MIVTMGCACGPVGMCLTLFFLLFTRPPCVNRHMQLLSFRNKKGALLTF